jgi:hypothetical protein
LDDEENHQTHQCLPQSLGDGHDITLWSIFGVNRHMGRGKGNMWMFVYQEADAYNFIA